VSPFSGGVRVDSAEALWGAEGAERVITLGEKSLLRRREDADGEPRFWMLEIVRRFATERVEEAALTAEAASRHSEYYFELVAQAEPHLIGPGQREWLDRLEDEQANIRAALEQLTRDDPGRAVQMAGKLIWFWEIRGYIGEAQRRLDDVLASAPPETPGRARALFAAGRIAQRYLGEAAQSEPLLLEALDSARREGDDRAAALSLSFLAGASEARGDLVEGAARHEEAIALARATGDDWALGNVLNGRAIAPSNRADLDLWISRLEEALEITRPTGDGFLTAVIAGNLAETVHDSGDVGRAGRFRDEALSRVRAIDSRSLNGMLLIIGAAISLELGQDETAPRQLKEAIETTALQAEDVATLTSLAGTLAAIEGRSVDAAMLWGAADHERRRLGVSESRAIARIRSR
jgi:tetratricopeptide (TPR) repeat protein